MKRQSMMLISLLGVALMTSASVLAQGGRGGMGVQGGMFDSSAVMQQDRLQTQTRDQLRIHQDPLLSLDQDQDKDQLRLQDSLQDKDQDQLRDRDRIHVPQ